MFENALKYSLKNEGGYIDHPMDKGGPTNKGITLATLSQWRGKACTEDDVQSLQDQEIRAIYKAYFWDPLNLEYLIDEPIQIAIFDIAINRGHKRSARYAQMAVNNYLTTEGILPLLKTDGVLGPRSI